jgi:hypothetical protein
MEEKKKEGIFGKIMDKFGFYPIRSEEEQAEELKKILAERMFFPTHALDSLSHMYKRIGKPTPEDLRNATQQTIDRRIAAYQEAWQSMRIPTIQRRNDMANEDDIALYSVYKVANGFYARMASGKMVVAGTLSEISTAANAQATDDEINSGKVGLKKHKYKKFSDAWEEAIAEKEEEEDDGDDGDDDETKVNFKQYTVT